MNERHTKVDENMINVLHHYYSSKLFFVGHERVIIRAFCSLIGKTKATAEFGLDLVVILSACLVIFACLLAARLHLLNEASNLVLNQSRVSTFVEDFLFGSGVAFVFHVADEVGHFRSVVACSMSGERVVEKKEKKG